MLDLLLSKHLELFSRVPVEPGGVDGGDVTPIGCRGLPLCSGVNFAQNGPIDSRAMNGTSNVRRTTGSSFS